MGTITVSDRLRSILKMPLFQPCGVAPTSTAISPTLVFTVSKRPVRLLVMPSISTPLNHSSSQSSMQYGSSNNGDFSQDFFDCSLHKKSREKCGGHFIRVKILERMVLKHIQLVTDYILRYEAHFRMIMEQQMKLESAEKILASRKKLSRDEKRIAELKRLFIKIYEDNASGRLSDERFDMLSQSYEAEQKQLEAEVVTLRQEIEVQARQSENIEKFIQTAQKYVSIETLDPYTLRELVQAIYVEAPDKSSGKRRQDIHIKYDGLGFIPPDELMKEETA